MIKLSMIIRTKFQVRITGKLMNCSYALLLISTSILFGTVSLVKNSTDSRSDKNLEKNFEKSCYYLALIEAQTKKIIVFFLPEVSADC